MTPLLFARADEAGLLKCGCRIALVVGVQDPYGKICWCATHAAAPAMLDLLFDLRGVPALSVATVERIRAAIAKALPPSPVPLSGPGEEVR